MLVLHSTEISGGENDTAFTRFNSMFLYDFLLLILSNISNSSKWAIYFICALKYRAYMRDKYLPLHLGWSPHTTAFACC